MHENMPFLSQICPRVKISNTATKGRPTVGTGIQRSLIISTYPNRDFPESKRIFKLTSKTGICFLRCLSFRDVIDSHGRPRDAQQHS